MSGDRSFHCPTCGARWRLDDSERLACQHRLGSCDLDGETYEGPLFDALARKLGEVGREWEQWLPEIDAAARHDGTLPQELLMVEDAWTNGRHDSGFPALVFKLLTERHGGSIQQFDDLWLDGPPGMGFASLAYFHPSGAAVIPELVRDYVVILEALDGAGLAQ